MSNDIVINTNRDVNVENTVEVHKKGMGREVLFVRSRWRNKDIPMYVIGIGDYTLAYLTREELMIFRDLMTEAINQVTDMEKLNNEES